MSLIDGAKDILSNPVVKSALIALGTIIGYIIIVWFKTAAIFKHYKKNDVANRACQ